MYGFEQFSNITYIRKHIIKNIQTIIKPIENTLNLVIIES